MRYTRQQKVKALTLLRASQGILRRWKVHTRQRTMRQLFDLALAAEGETARASD